MKSRVACKKDMSPALFAGRLCVGRTERRASRPAEIAGLTSPWQDYPEFHSGLFPVVPRTARHLLTGRRASSEFAVFTAIEEIDRQSNKQPHEEPHPRNEQHPAHQRHTE